MSEFDAMIEWKRPEVLPSLTAAIREHIAGASTAGLR